MSVDTKEELIKDLYASFAALNAEGMAKCYHEEIQFQDPAFGILKGERAMNMWRMLCERQKGKDFKINLISSSVEDDTGSATWEAFYTFGKTGRKVHNIINAQFNFQDGKIIEHKDSFDLYKWSKQAFGPMGVILGWTSFFERKVKTMSNEYLDSFEKKMQNTTM